MQLALSLSLTAQRGGLVIALALSIPADASDTLIADMTGDPAWADWPLTGDVAGILTTPFGGAIAVTVTAAGALVEDTPGQWAAACFPLVIGNTFTPTWRPAA